MGMMMMINRRRVCGGKKLPYDAEIEYLESTGNGNQFIDTGVGIGYSTNVLDIQAVFQHLSTSGMYKWVIISMLSQNTVIGVQRNGVNCYIDGIINKQFDLVTDTWREYHFNGNNNYEGVDNYQFIPNNGSLTTNILLFALDNSGTNAEKCRIKYIKISYNNIIVRDLIPVRVGQTGYMYDKISGELIGNAGTSNFILGPDV